MLNLSNSINFLCNNAYTEIQAATLTPWFLGLDLGLGLEICGIGLEQVGLGLGFHTTGLIPITAGWCGVPTSSSSEPSMCVVRDVARSNKVEWTASVECG